MCEIEEKMKNVGVECVKLKKNIYFCCWLWYMFAALSVYIIEPEIHN